MSGNTDSRKTTSSSRGYLLGMVSAVCYGTNALFSLPLLREGVGVNSVLFLRYALAVLLYAAMVAGVRRQSLALPRAAVLPVAVLSLLFVGSSLALYSAFLYIDGGLACTILFVYPALVTLLSVCFFGEKPSLKLWAALAASMLGVLLLYRGEAGAALDWRGVVWSLASAAFYAFYILGVRHIRPVRELPARVLTFYVMLFGTGVFALNGVGEGTLQWPSSPLQWLCVAALAIIPTIISLETFTLALHRIGAVRLSILCSAEPLVAVFLGVTLYGESFTLKIVLGVALILSGVLAVVRK